MLKYGSYYCMEEKEHFAAQSCRLGKHSRVTRYVIIKSFVRNQAAIDQRKADSTGVFVQKWSDLVYEQRIQVVPR